MSLNVTDVPFHFEIASDPIGRSILLTVFLLQQTLGNALLLGLLWYERHGQDIRRTLYNQIFSMSFSCVLLTNVTNQVVGFIVLFYNPGFPEWFCWARDLVIKFSLIYGSFFAAQLSTLKYCYVVLWKRVVAMDDDFLATFLLTLNVFLSLFGALLDHLWNGPHLADMCLCMDVDWSTYYPYRFQDQTPGVLAFMGFCFLLDMGMAARVGIQNLVSSSKRNAVVRFQRTIATSSPIKRCIAGCQGVCGMQSTGAMVSLGVSSFGHWIYILSLMPLALFAVAYEDNPEALNAYPLNLYYILAYVGPSLILYIFLPLVYYWKHPEILKAILISLHEDIHDTSCC